MAPLQPNASAEYLFGSLLKRAYSSAYYAQRSAFSAISLMCIAIVVCMMTIRVRQFWKLRIINASRVVTVLFYFTSFAALFVFNHVYQGVGLTMNGNTCKSSILVCITFYVVSKYLIYVFMQERIHTIRSAEYTRLRDLPYMFSMTVVSIGSPAILAYALTSAKAEMDESQTCKMGLPPNAASALLAWDTCVNIWLTLLFCSLLLPTLRTRAQFQAPASMTSFTRHLVGVTKSACPTPVQLGCSRSSSPEPVELVLTQTNEPVVSLLERLIKKSLVGVVLLCIPSTVNLAMFIGMKGMESGFQCFLTCTLDITTTCFVFHWLTMTPQETQSGEPLNSHS